MFSHDQEQGKMGRAALALALALGLAGCAEPADPLGDAADPAVDVPVAEEPAGASAPPAPPPPPVADVCPEGNRIGKLGAAGICPAAAGWSKNKLFPAGSPAPLNLYCQYTWTGGGPADPSSIPSDGDRSGSEWTQPDCMAVTVMSTAADAAETAVKGSLNQAFWNTVERPAGLPSQGFGGANVRVAIIDAWPSFNVAGTSRHGIGMAGVVDDLVCDVFSGSCPVNIVPHLALNILESGTIDNTNGGYFGFQSNLARKIEEAAYDAEAEQPLAKLILNLSIGWDAAYQEYAPAKVRPSALAVRDAIEYAVCKGALVIAAAGNTSFGPAGGAPEGLLYPAAWGAETAACSGNPHLVVPVGALDALDRKLYNARENGMPPLAAPGELAYGTVQKPGMTVMAGPFSGSSVSAAVTTAAAAMVWMYQGSRTADQVMDLVGATALPLTLDATACGGAPSCGQVQRVSLCRALKAIDPGVACATHPEGTGAPAQWTEQQLFGVEALAAVDFPGPPLTNALEKNACSIPVFRRDNMDVPGPNACPIEQYHNSVLLPITGPQPGSDPCGACALAIANPSEATLEMAVSSELDAPAFAQTLTLFTAGVAVARYDISLLAYTDTYGDVHRVKEGLLPGVVYKLHLTGLNGDSLLPSPIDAAIIEWVDDVGGAGIQTTSRVVVFQR